MSSLQIGALLFVLLLQSFVFLGNISLRILVLPELLRFDVEFIVELVLLLLHQDFKV
jgi:hypothetical protein